MSYSSPKGYALTDWRLYLPESWLKDPKRCKEAEIPEDTVFQTKAQLVQEMLEKALAAGHRASCLTADADYGKAPYLRAFLRQERIAFALGLQKKVLVVWLKGKLRPLHAAGRLRGAEVSLEQISQDVQEWLMVPLRSSQGGNPYEWAFTQIRYEGERYGLVMRRFGKDIWQAWYRHVILCTVLIGLLARLKSQFREEDWSIAQLCRILRLPFLALVHHAGNIRSFCFEQQKSVKIAS